MRNYQAANNLKAMKRGDRAFFYHSNEGLEIVGIAEIAKEAYPDPSDATGRFVMVEVKPVRRLKRPVTLAADQGRAQARRFRAGAPGAALGRAGDGARSGASSPRWPAIKA